jgi:hypothetical protein
MPIKPDTSDFLLQSIGLALEFERPPIAEQP